MSMQTESHSEPCGFTRENRVMIKAMAQDITEIKDAIQSVKRAVCGRPSWTISIFMTFLCSVCVGLLVLVLSK